MPDERDLRMRVEMRDRGLGQLNAVTGAVAVATAALAGLFAGLAAQTTAARKLIQTQPRATLAPVKQGSGRRRPASIPPPPPLPPVGSSAPPAPPPTPAASAQPPTPTQAAPVVVSGGS